jgi:pimeloyl-ACP methyl ester carboxylesterase
MTMRAILGLVALITALAPVPALARTLAGEGGGAGEVLALAAADAPAQDLHFDSDGVKIHYTVEGEGEPVILVHGFTASIATNWDAPGIIDALAKDYRVIALDARGHGQSGKPHQPEAYGFRMTEDVIRLMDHLGILKAHIAGYSMGGGIALQAVVTYPDRFYSAILGGAGWRPPGSGFEALMTPLADSLEQGKGLGPLILALNPAGAPKPTAEQIAAINARLLADNDALALAAVIRGGAGNRPITADELRANRVPMLAVVGEIDPVKASVDGMVGTASQLEVVVLPGKDHLSAVADPELAKSIHAFLMKH